MQSQKNFVFGPQTMNPIGTSDELERLELVPKLHHSCSLNDERSNLGCPYFETCQRAYKGKTFVEGGGPHNHAVLLITLEGNEATMFLPCYIYEARRPHHQEHGEVYEIVGDEGDTVTLMETVEEPVPGKPGRYRVRHVPVPREVPKFERPEVTMQRQAYHREVRKVLEERQRRELLDRTKRSGPPRGGERAPAPRRTTARKLRELRPGDRDGSD